MDIDIATPDRALPVERAWVISMTIKSFKGRKDVEVHLFRPDYDTAEAEGYDWDALLGDPVHPELPVDLQASRRVLLEAFTPEERDQVLEYLKSTYEDRVSQVVAAPMDLPIPLGLPPLSDIPEGKSIGFIRFDKLPNYSLPFGLRGFYDLAQHEPLVQE
jgi:hypothetical protein